MRKVCLSLLALLAATPLMLAACADDGASASPQADGGTDGTIPGDAGPDEAAPGDAAADADAMEVMPCSKDGFCHTALPAGQTLRDVWGDGAGVVWSVTEQGNILRWDGRAWVIHHTAPSGLFAIWGSSPTDVWVGGADGLLHGQGPSSEALVFGEVDLPERDGIPILSLSGRGVDDVWAAGGRADTMQFPPIPEGRVFHLGGQGPAWTREAVLERDAVFTKVWGTAAGDVFVGGYDFESFPEIASNALLLHRSPAELGFSEVRLPLLDQQGLPQRLELLSGGGSVADKLVLLTVNTDQAAYVVGAPAADGGTGLEWSDERFSLHPSHVLRAVWGSTANDVWLAGDFGRLRHWDGTAWTLPRISTAQMPVVATFRAIWARSPDDLWVVGDGIALHKANQN